MSNARDKANIPALNFSSTGIDDNATSTALTIDSSGDVGINNTAPNLNPFNKAVTLSGTNNCGYELAKGSTLHGAFALQGDNRVQVINFQSADITFNTTPSATERMRITSAGNVGIGTSSPNFPLEIYKASTSEVAIGTDNGGTAQLSFWEGNSSTKEFFVKYDGFNNNGVIGTSGSSNAIVIARDTGNVGIGTTSPNAKLHVNGLIEANGSLYRGIFGGAVQDADMTGATGGNGSEVQIQSPSSGRPASLTLGGSLGNNESLGVIGFYNSGNTNGKRLRAYIRSGQEGATANEQGARILFATANNAASTPTERMRIDSSGGLGVGDTPFTETRLTLKAPAGGNQYMVYGKNGAGTHTLLITGSGNITNYYNSYGALSDENLKQDITLANSQWNDIKSLQIKNYKLKSDVESNSESAPKLLGVVAQDLESSNMSGLVSVQNEVLWSENEELPEGVNVGDVKEPSYKSVKYSVLYMKSIKALQEAMTRIETLEAKVTALETTTP